MPMVTRGALWIKAARYVVYAGWRAALEGRDAAARSPSSLPAAVVESGRHLHGRFYSYTGEPLPW